MSRRSNESGDFTRDPCPLVILNDFGGAFTVGAVGGAVFYGIKGFRNSPYGERWQGIRSAVKVQAPLKAGNFGTWGGLFGFFDCAIKSVRSTEDMWNSILAGAFTGGSLAIRGGYKSFRTNFIFGGIALAVIEGMMVAMNRYMAEPPQAPVLPDAQ